MTFFGDDAVGCELLAASCELEHVQPISSRYLRWKFYRKDAKTQEYFNRKVRKEYALVPQQAGKERKEFTHLLASLRLF